LHNVKEEFGTKPNFFRKKCSLRPAIQIEIMEVVAGRRRTAVASFASKNGPFVSSSGGA
jgi:hypothetical protein